MNSELIKKLIPFTLSLGIVGLDQITKWLVSINIRAWSVGPSFFGDILRIIRVYNPGIAFSIGHGLPADVRSIFFGLVPLLVIGIVVVVSMRSTDLSKFQRWSIAGIVGGGLGNLIDRFFRPEGVLDFIDVRVFGFLGFERWPTFNVADASVVVCGLLLMLSLFQTIRAEKNAEKKEVINE